MRLRGTICFADSDGALLSDVVRAAQSCGLQMRSCRSVDGLLAAEPLDSPCCFIVHADSLFSRDSELLAAVRRKVPTVPFIVVNERPSTATVVRAMRAGASTVIDQPVDASLLETVVEQAFRDQEKRIKELTRVAQVKKAIATLSEKERSVLDLILEGQPNKEIARALGVSVRTVENRRSRVFHKLNASSLSHLVRHCIASGYIDP